MNTLRTKAVDIISEIPEEYIVYVIGILENIKNISHKETKLGKFPMKLTKRNDSEEIENVIDEISGAVVDSKMTLDEYRKERLAKYEAVA